MEIDVYPFVAAVLKWMENFWSSEPCYSEYNVDGSLCSHRIYLSEVSVLWMTSWSCRGMEYLDIMIVLSHIYSGF